MALYLSTGSDDALRSRSRFFFEESDVVHLGSMEAAFLEHLAPGDRDAFSALGDLEARLTRAVDQARDTHATLAVRPEAFLKHLARHMAGQAPERAFEHLHAADLWLALGCAQGDPASIRAFDAQFDPDVDAALRRVRRADVAEDDMRQALREKLFVGREDRAPKIADYAGQGFLQNWLRITALRTFTDLVRAAGRNPERPDDDLMRLADADDLELSFLKKHYRSAFKEAFEDAVMSLEPRERNLLRHSWVRGLSIDQLAALHHIHRATAARRLNKARETLLSQTRQALMKRLEMGRDDVESVIRLIRSRLDMSLERVLGDATEHGGKAVGD